MHPLTSSPRVVGRRACQNGVDGFRVRVNDYGDKDRNRVTDDWEMIIIVRLIVMNMEEAMVMSIENHCGVGGGA